MNDKELGDWLAEHEMYLYAVARGAFKDANYEPDYDDVREVVADAMYRMWRSLHTFTARPGLKDPFRAWAAMIVRRRVWTALQALRRRQQPVLLEHQHPTVRGPEPTYIQRETARRYLAYLSEIQQTAVTMLFLGYDYDAIATHLNVTWADVKSIVSGARRRVWRREAKES